MSVRITGYNLFAALLLGIISLTAADVTAKDSELNIAEFHQILDAVKKSEIPEQVKAQLLRDMRTTLIKSVESADIPEHAKQSLIRDLESTSGN